MYARRFASLHLARARLYHTTNSHTHTQVQQVATLLAHAHTFIYTHTTAPSKGTTKHSHTQPQKLRSFRETSRHLSPPIISFLATKSQSSTPSSKLILGGVLLLREAPTVCRSRRSKSWNLFSCFCLLFLACFSLAALLSFSNLGSSATNSSWLVMVSFFLAFRHLPERWFSRRARLIS